MKHTQNAKKSFSHQNGRLYFTKHVEQKVLFLCTLALLLWGAFLKIGVL